MEAASQVPALWAEVAGDLAAWLKESREQQGRIEGWVATESTEEARDGLVELHSTGEVLLQDFDPKGQSRGVEGLEEAMQKADAGPAAVARIAAVAREQASALQVELEAQDFVALQQRLEGQRAHALRGVQHAVEAIKEAGDMDEKAQGAKIEAKRISRSLLSAESPVDQLLQLSSPAGWSKEMAAQLSSCRECEAAAEKELAALEKMHQEESSLLSACEAERRARIAQGEAKRKVLKQALRTLKAADEDFREWHLENEILRKQSCLLKARAEKSGEAIKLARPALAATKAACGRWSSCAEQEAEKLQKQRGEVAGTRLLEAQPLIATVALNVELALQISQFVGGSKENELQGLKQQQQLAERRPASEAEQRAMQEKVGACERELLELGEMVKEAQCKLESILGLATSQVRTRQGRAPPWPCLTTMEKFRRLEDEMEAKQQEILHLMQALRLRSLQQEAAGSDLPPAATAALRPRRLFVEDEAASQDQASTSRPSEPTEREESKASWEQALPQEREVQRLTAELRGPCQQFRAKRAQLAQRKDVRKEFCSRLAACRQKLEEVRSRLEAAKTCVQACGLPMEEQNHVAEVAKSIAESVYFPLKHAPAIQHCNEGSSPCDIQQFLQKQGMAIARQLKLDQETAES